MLGITKQKLELSFKDTIIWLILLWNIYHVTTLKTNKTSLVDL